MTELDYLTIQIPQSRIENLNYAVYLIHLKDADPTKEYASMSEAKVHALGLPSNKINSHWDDIFGIEILDQNIVKVRGMNLFQRNNNGKYVLSDDAKELLSLYNENSEGIEWKIKFVEILSKYNIRVRTILYYIGRLGYKLRFSNINENGFFSNPAKDSALVKNNEEIFFLRKNNENTGEMHPFNQLMDKHINDIIGPFILEYIKNCGINTDRDIILTPVKGNEPSTRHIESVLKIALSIYKDLKILVYDNSLWKIDYQRAKEILNQEIVSDLFPSKDDPLKVFKKLLFKGYNEYKNSDGLIQHEKLAQYIGKELNISHNDLYSYVCRNIQNLEYNGNLRIIRHKRGLPIDGIGLCGNQDYQYIEIEFIR